MKSNIKRAKHIIPRLNFEAKKKIYYSKYILRKKISVNGHKQYSYEYLKNNINRAFLSDYEQAYSRLKENKTIYEEIIQAADNTLNNRFYILHNYYDDVCMQGGHYKWFTDPLSGYTYPKKYKSFYNATVHYEEKQFNQDLKGPWEMSRLQFLIAPAIAWNLTKEDKYADKVLEIVRDWIEINTIDEGPNWACTMEAGIRVVNMLLAFQLIVDYEKIPDSFANIFMLSIKEHLNYILWNLENYAGRTYNHYLGDIIGILSIVATCPFLPNARKLYVKYKREFELQMEKQVLNDGGDFEGSTCYHCLVGEMFALAALIVKNYNDSFSAKYYEKLGKMADFSILLRKKGGIQPQIGDNDSGRVIDILPHNPLNYDWFINLANYLVHKKYHSSYYADLLSFMLGNGPVDSGNNNGVIYMPEFGLVGYRDDNIYILLSGTEAQKHGLGGHTHNDKLSLEVSYKGVDFIVDPGSGAYTSNMDKHCFFRSVRAHSSVVVSGEEQNKAQIVGYFGNSYDCKTIVEAEDSQQELFKMKGFCEAQNGNINYTHYRTVAVEDSQIKITDTIKGCEDAGLCLNLTLDPNVSVTIQGNKAILSSKNVEIVIITENNWDQEKSFFSPSYGKIIECSRLFSCFPCCGNTYTFSTWIQLE